VKTEASPSDFNLAAKNIVCSPQFRPPTKMKFERLTYSATFGAREPLLPGAEAAVEGVLVAVIQGQQGLECLRADLPDFLALDVRVGVVDE
jgi:hypothetical protein